MILKKRVCFLKFSKNEKMKKYTIAIILGGISAERDISIASGKNIADCLRAKFKIEKYDLKYNLKKLFLACQRREMDLVYPLLHGRLGEDGTLQGFLELLQIPYFGSGVLGSALGINKLAQREILEYHKIEVPKYWVIKKDEKIKEGFFVKFCRRSGWVTKPNSQGSSVGVSICKNKKELKKGIRKAGKFDDIIIIEKYIKGREITVGVWGDAKAKTLPVVEIIPKEKFFNYKAKYDPETEEIVPAEIPKNVSQKAQKIAVEVYKVLRCSGICRVDMIWDDKKNKIYVLEINTIPGMTETSLIPKAIKAAGFGLAEFLEKLIMEKIKGQ